MTRRMGDMLAGRVAVVTGAGRGIGRGVALALADAGAKVVVNDYGVARDGSSASSGPAFDVVKEIEAAGGEAVANTESVAEWDGAKRIIETAVSRFGRIDVLVTCAGIVRDRMVFNMSEEEFDAVLAVHLKGTFNCLRHAAPLMREQRYGRVVTFTSGAGLFGNPGQTNYGAAKSAIGGLTKVAARDLGRYGVTVNAVSPIAGTRMTVTEAYLKGRELRKQQGIVREDRGTGEIESLNPDDVAPMVVYLASEYASAVNGQFFLCWGNAVALLSQPRLVQTLYKDGVWTLDELDRLAPSTVLAGVKNPAPPKE
jgi:NAD(P)-dependent dehydrogenase (short-subunit alcohol dehydrogenase family)